MRQGLPVLLQRSIRQRPWEAPAFSNLKTRKVSCDTLEEALQQAEENRKKRQMGYQEAMDALKRREGSPLPHPSLRVRSDAEAYQMPHYPEAYLESKHCMVFAHWRPPKGVAQWTGFLAAQLYGAGAATIAHVPAWLPGTNIPRERVWQRRLLLLESIAPVPGSAAALAGFVKALWSLRQDAEYIQAFQQESQNAQAHLVALLSIRPSAAQKLLVLISQALFAPTYMLAFTLAPRACHAFMTTLSGLTGEALTDALADLDAGKIPAWSAPMAASASEASTSEARAAGYKGLPAPVLAYWGLPEGVSMRAVLLAMRADVAARMVVNQGADFKTLSLKGELSTLAEHLNEEDPLDYTESIEDVELPRDLYSAQKSGSPSTPMQGQSRQLSTQRGLPSIREGRPSGLRRFWQGSRPASSASNRAPSVSSQASSEHESAQSQNWPSTGSPDALRRRRGRPASSIASSSDLDSAQAAPRDMSKRGHSASSSLQLETPEESRRLSGRNGSPLKDSSDITSVMERLWGRGF